MKHCVLALISVLISTLTALTQPDHATHLKSGTVPPGAFLPARDFTEHPQEQARSGNYYVLLLQFETLPVTYEQQAPLCSAGILLDAYIPDHTYLARVPQGVDLEALGTTYYLPYLPEYKLSAALTFAPESEMEEGLFNLVVYPYPMETMEDLYHALQEEGYTDLHITENGVEVSVSMFGLNTLAAHASIMYIESAAQAPVAESIPGRSLHRANFLSSGPGQGIDGTGVSMAVADDGPVNHEDFKGRITQYATSNLGNHGDMVTGIACGAGNIDPQAVGAAPGATLHLYPIEGYPHIEQAPQNYALHGTVVTVTSYSESQGGEYSYSAYALDGQAIEHPNLMHVFSAGNNAADAASPLYSNIMTTDGMRHGNITGGRKASKSAIAVGNVYDNDDIRTSSSRGPAGDGRIKPDICSHGQGQLSTNTNNTYQFGGGTSAAAPGVGGGLATLVQLYRSLHAGANPNGGLLKAALLNSAEDLGRPGPDYTYGWGRMNLARAASTLQNNQHFNGTVVHGGQQNHTIAVPANTKQIRVMTYWNDVPGAPMAGKALVNDLDSRLISPGNQSSYSWAISAYPHPDSLIKPAWRGTDRLNNMEQIIIDNPAAGNYTLRVNGYLVPQGPQSYHVVYCFITKDLEITYPIGGEGFVPGETQIIRWDATTAGQSGTFALSYSTDDMASWIPIASNIAAHLRQYTWTVPNVASGRVFVRVSRGSSQTSISPAAFTIIGQPNFQVHYNTANSATVTWPAVPGATSYVVYALGDKYMMPVGTTTSNSYNVNVAAWENKWYSVAASASPGTAGRRAYAKKYIHTPCDVWVTLTLHFDLYPGETRWEIVSNSGMVIASGGPYTSQAPNSILSLQQCLPAGCYELVVYDSYGDGMCCNRGTGSYLLMNTSGGVLASGAQFTGAQVVPFCVTTGVTPLTIQVAEVQPVRCKGGQDGWISVQATGGTGNYSYTWNTGATGPNLANVAAGTYTVTVSDGTNQVQLSVMVSQPVLTFTVALSPSSVACNSGPSNGSISATVSGGTAPYTYLWSNGATTTGLSGLATGTYSLTVTDANGCMAVASAAVQPASSLSLNLTPVHVNCFGGQTGAISVTPGGGTAPYNCVWSNGATGTTISGLAAGIYAVTATDAHGCSASASVTIQQTTPLELQLLPETVSCYGGADGMIFTTVSGGSLPYTYTWSSGNATTGWLGNLSAGNYALTVTDFKGCTVQKNTAVPQPAQIAIAVNTSPAAGGNSGSVSIEISGGVAPYTYLWSNGATTQSISGLVAGTYTVLVRDAHECSKSATATVTNAQPPTIAYCNARGSSTNFEWIQRIQIGNFVNESGNNGGYALFSTTPLALAAGTAYALTLTPGYQNNAFNESWRIWLDLNHDGDFYDTGELLFAPALSNTLVSGSITIPSGALSGPTRMRISMKYGSPSNPCGVFAYGEVEDYAVVLSSNNGNLSMAPEAPAAEMSLLLQPEEGLSKNTEDQIDMAYFRVLPDAADFTLYPNPAGSFVFCRHTGQMKETGKLSVFDSYGKLVRSQEVELCEGSQSWQLSLDGLPAGCYRVQLDCASHSTAKPLVVNGR